MRRSFILGLALAALATGEFAIAATLTDAGALRFQLTEFAVGDTSPLTSIAVDQSTGAVYAAGFGTEGTIMRARPGDDIATFVGQLRPPNVGDALIFPFRSTDILHQDGGIYTLLGGTTGTLVRLDTETGESTELIDLTDGDSLESGVAIFGSDLVVTSGRGAFELFVYNFDSESVTHTMEVEFEPGDLEADPLNKMFGYVAPVEEGPVLHVNPYTGSSTETGVHSPQHGAGDFAVGPRGEAIYMMLDDGIWELDIATGGGEMLFETETDPALIDLAFGPSSSSGGVSLYITEGELIWEASGFTAIPEPSVAAAVLLGIALLSHRRIRC